MPFELMRGAFFEQVDAIESETVKDQIAGIYANEMEGTDYYSSIIEKYETDTGHFQEKITKTYAVPSPESTTIRLDLEMVYSKSITKIPSYLQHIPENSHPSRFMMEIYKQDDAISLYRAVTEDKEKSREEILELYNDRLDLFIFAHRTFLLKKSALREAAAKNDWLDILHTTYLFSHDQIIVTDDKMFDGILPDINLLTVAQYKKLI
jgi:hypothetical protein